MKIALATVQVPFIRGGAEILADHLKAQLQRREHSVEIVSIPFKWYPGETLLESMVMARLIDITEVNGERIDLMIGLKFPAYFAPHPNKVIWLLHQHRQVYDLWGTEFGDVHQWPDGEFIRSSIMLNDRTAFSEAKRVFTISQNVSNRLQRFNSIPSTPLYHPPMSFERLHSIGYEPFVYYPSRIDPMKRQRLLIDAARHLGSNARIVLSGTGSEKEVQCLYRLIEQNGVQDRVKLLGFVSEDQKIDYLSRCSAVFFGAHGEDYGYVTLEAMFSQKPVIALTDTGGALEFVRDGYNGYIVEPDAQLVARRIDDLITSPAHARQLGINGLTTIREKSVNWDCVLDCLLKAGRG